MPRLGRPGGGIGLLYRENINVNNTTSCKYQSFEYSEWIIDIKNFRLIVAGLYRPPYSEMNRFTQSQFLAEIPSLLEKLCICSEPILILGDINFHCEVRDDPFTKKLTSLLKSFDMKQHVDVPTHVSGHTLDAIISRCNDTIEITNITADNYISDHCFTSFNINKPKSKLTTKEVTFRKWNKLDEKDFIQDIDNKFAEINDCTDVDVLVKRFDTSIIDIIDKHLPQKTKTCVVRPAIPWYSDYLREFKRFRRKIESIYMKFKNDIAKEIYNKIKIRYSAAVSYAKAQYYRNKIQESKNKTKHLYNTISDLTGRTKQNPLPASPNDETLANEFLEFFISKIETIRRDLDNISSKTSPCVEHIQSGDTQQHNTVFNHFKPLSESDVRRLILESKSTTCELDVIPTPKLKLYIDHLLPPITHIINTSLSSGIFPAAWKKALVKPLIKKKGLPTILKNYRPVSNLSFLSKVLEKAALEQIVEHVENNGFLPDYQSAYRKNRGVETTLIKMYDDLLHASDNKLVSIVVMIDLSAAFDTVDIPILLSILKSNFNIDGTPLQWIKTYLNDRTMNVVINGSLSKTQHLKYGVPQGSCAGPVVFTLYIAALNSIVQKSCPNIIIYGYADDHKLSITCRAGNNISEMEAKLSLEECLSNIIKWMADHKLKMNNDKTEVIVYGTKQQLNKLNIKSINVGGTEVKCVMSVRDLGVTLNNDLSLDNHIKKKCQTASFHLRNIKKIRHYLSKSTTEILIHGLVNSHLDFCNGLFVDQPQYLLNKLQVIQNRAARVIFNVKYDHSAEPLLRSLHWLPVRARVQFKILTIVHKCLNKTAPVYLQSLLNYHHINRQLRSSNQSLLHIPRVNTRLAERSFRVAGPKLWNTLPACLKNTTDENKFRRDLKTHLFKTFYRN